MEKKFFTKLKWCMALGLLWGTTQGISAQRGYYDAPYTRYEAEDGTGGGTTQTSWDQGNIASEASGRTCVQLNNGNSREWTAKGKFRGIVVRASSGQEGGTGKAKLYVGGNYVTTMNLEDSYGWKHMNDNAQNYGDINNGGSRMRFQEARHLLNASQNAGTTIRIEAEGTLYLDFIEIEDVADPIAAPAGYKTYTGNGGDLQSWLDSNGGNVYIPAGTYYVSGCINVGSRTIQGAGMWHTKLVWSSNASTGNMGLCSYSTATVIKDMALDNTVSKSRSNNHKGLNGVWGGAENLWITHFECGAWFGNYNGGYGDPICTGMTIKNCRFRYNYADGINFCQGTQNSTASHCDFRGNGDDDMAIWPASDGGRGTCSGNTFEYNTAEFCWFASSVACYGGSNNTWHDIVIRDNREVGIRINGKFAGYGYGNGNKMYNIDVIRCGTWKDSYSNPVGAVDLSGVGAKVNPIGPVALSCIDITDAGADAVWCQGGTGFSNLTLCGFTVNGTGREGNNNDNGNKGSWLYGYAFRAVDNPSGVSYNQNTCTSSNLGGSSGGSAYRDWGSVTNNTGLTCSCAKVEVTGVTLDKTTLTLGIGETQGLTATIAPTNATNKSVTWKSSNENIATVDGNGNVTGKAAGTATITVTTAENNKTATCAVTVKAIAVTGISFESNNVAVAINGTATVKANVAPTNATNQGVTYQIVNGGDYATVDAATGVVTGKTVGQATVRATSADGGYTADCTIEVVACTPVDGVNLEVIEVTINPANPVVGDEVSFTATVRNNSKNTVTQGFGVVFGVDGETTWSAGNEKFLWCDEYKGENQQASVGKVNITACSTLDFTSNGGAADKSTWKAEVGNHTVNIVLDDNNWITGTKTVKDFSFTVSDKPASTITGVTLNQTAADLWDGETVTLVATVSGTEDYNNAVTWETSNTGIATVNNGVVTGVNDGVATITARSVQDNTKTASATITVTKRKITAVSITDKTAGNTTHLTSETIDLVVNVEAVGDIDKSVTWASDNTNVNVVNGRVTATGDATATITVTSVVDGTKSDNITLTFVSGVVEGVTVEADAAEVKVGKTLKATATVTGQGIVPQGVVWTSNNQAVATVSADGTITGVSAGTATITATSTADNTKANSVTITVTPIEVTAVTITNKPGAAVSTKETLTLTATVTGDEGVPQTVEWTSSNTAVATIDANGKITALAAGTTTFTAQSTADRTKSDAVEVTFYVPVVAVTGVTLGSNTAAVNVGETVGLVATVNPADATNTKVTYESNNTAVATVDENGVVSGVSEGTAVITVTTEDGGYTATCTVTVSEKPECTGTGKADVEILSFETIPANPEPGDEVAFSITVRNVGGTTLTKGFGIVCYVDRSSTDNAYRAGDNSFFWNDETKDSGLNIEPCDTRTFVTNGGDKGGNIGTWTASTGTHSVRVRLDDDGALDAVEDNKDNNTFTYIVEVKINNVAVEGVTFDMDKTDVSINETVKLNVKFTPEDASNQNVTYEVVSGDASVSGDVLTIGETTGSVVVRVTTEDGNFTDEITLDASDCPAGTYDLVIDNITWEPQVPQVGQAIKFTAVIRNAASGATPTTGTSANQGKHGLLFQIYDGDTHVMSIWNDQHYTSIGGCESVSLTSTGGSVENCGGAWTPERNGLYRIVATVNDQDGDLVPAETNKANNVLEITDFVVGASDANGVETIGGASKEKQIQVNRNTVIVSGLERGEQVDTYNILGAKVESLKAAGDVLTYPLDKGIYIVRILGTTVVKKILIVE